MAEKRDAFGNPIGPQQTQGVPGGPTVGRSRPSESGLPNTQSATTGVPQQYDDKLQSSGPQASNESFGTKRVKVGNFGSLSIVILVVIIIGGAMLIGGLNLFNGVKDSFDSVKTSIEKSTNGGRTSASGITGASMMSPDKFGEAKRMLTSSNLGEPYVLAIYPEYLSTQLIKGSTQSSVLINNNSDSLDLQSTSDASPSLDTFKVSEIGDDVPARAVRRGASLLNQSADDIDYVVISNILDKISINGYFKNGDRFVANSRGGDVQKAG